MLNFLEKRREERRVARLLFQAVHEHARQRVFYESYDVPDTTDGRFDLICVHAFLLIDRFQGEGRDGRRLAQALFDEMFREMEYALREMGVGDLSVPKHMKRMMKGFNGRALAYRQAMRAAVPETLAEALLKNLYGAPVAAPVHCARLMALYMREAGRHLAGQRWEDLASGQVDFMPIESYYVEEQAQSSPARVAA